MQKEMARNPHLLVKYWGDAACRQYLQQFYSPALLSQFDSNARGCYSGAYRGDICRTAVLYREGGFYMDMDLQLLGPLGSFLPNGSGAKFLAVRNSNMLLAAAPRHPILNATLEDIIPWYQRYDANESDPGPMGPATLGRGFKRFCACGMECEPQRSLITCGEHAVRLYRESYIECKEPPTEACPADRLRAFKVLAARGLGNKHLTSAIHGPPPQNHVMGWNRFAGCPRFGCGGAGYSSGTAFTWDGDGCTDVRGNQV